jgi:hypothetical protein
VYVPTAVQATADEHETGPRAEDWASVGAGKEVNDHVVPFHLAAKKPGPGSASPTTTHAVTDGHDTPLGIPPWLEMACTIHVLPFQIIRYGARKLPPITSARPTAMHMDGRAQDTAVKPVAKPPGTFTRVPQLI